MNNGEFVGESYLDEFENGVAESRLPEIVTDKVKQSAAEVGCGMAENHVPWVLLRSTDIEVGDFWNQVEDDKIVTFSAGSIIAFRKDGKQLTARHLEAVVAYHLEVIIPKMTDLSESAWKERNKDKGKCDTEKLEEARKEMLANFVCKASFEKFFQEYKQKKIESGDAEWAKAVSPYEV
ncbi:hypothetical protein M7I_6896 [Glarea lozoyensis 74030]|uniref:Uncharacterized protein n=1 Tax=Glarea lozoyensis (strain ATCC 74030 / MF5533) TaxID=1104152 RepID=H0EVU0_GLAL7|nr:hypothetical protein M7I_6896 [Glarea lozoyensis 74030]